MQLAGHPAYTAAVLQTAEALPDQPEVEYAACERCGDFAGYQPRGLWHLCKVCEERLPVRIDGQLRIGRLLRDTFRVAGKLGSAALSLWPLCTPIFALQLWLALAQAQKSPVAAVALFALSTGTRLLVATFIASASFEELQGSRRGVAHAFRATLQHWRGLLWLTLLASLPLLLEVALNGGVPKESSGPSVGGLLIIAAVFVPPLMVSENQSLARALRDSPAALRACLLPAFVGFSAFAVGTLIVQQVVNWLILRAMMQFTTMPRLVIYELVARDQPIATLLLAPLMVYADVLRTLLLLHVRAKQRNEALYSSS